jgi:class 3 adenylate cyclase
MREERKVVTALFADVVGSTQLTERMDPEDAREVLGGAVGRMVDAVEAFGGTVKDLAGTGSSRSSARRRHMRTTPSGRSAPRSASSGRAMGVPRRSRSVSASRPGWWCSVRSAGEGGSSTGRPATR